MSDQLGNTPTICRTCYVHPAVIEAYLGGNTLRVVRERLERELDDDLGELEAGEALVMALLRDRLQEHRADAEDRADPPA